MDTVNGICSDAPRAKNVNAENHRQYSTWRTDAKSTALTTLLWRPRIIAVR